MNDREIKEIIALLLKQRDLTDTRWSNLESDGNKQWAVVLAWQDGFDNEGDDGKYKLNEYRICGKIAYNDSYMHEYDIDWLMPSDEHGDVYDSEISLESDNDVSFALACWDKSWKVICDEYRKN